MKVLIVYASKYGSTGGVAEAIADAFRERGHEADLHEAASATAPDGHDAVVVGSGVYMGSWLKPAVTYLDTHAASLLVRPVWLFGVGPLGAENPQPAGEPQGTAELVERVGARSYQTFTGALDRGRLSLIDKMVARAVKAPDGDFRDWPAIRAWAHGVADALDAGVPAARVPAASIEGAEGGRA